MSDVTQILPAIQKGDPKAAHELLPMVYEELRRLARSKMAQQPPGHTLQATALVHEAYIRLVSSPKRESAEVQFVGRAHFFAAAAEAMRRILVDLARRKQALKRGAGPKHPPLEPDRLVAPVVDVDL